MTDVNRLADSGAHVGSGHRLPAGQSVGRAAAADRYGGPSGRAAGRRYDRIRRHDAADEDGRSSRRVDGYLKQILFRRWRQRQRGRGVVRHRSGAVPDGARRRQGSASRKRMRLLALAESQLKRMTPLVGGPITQEEYDVQSAQVATAKADVAAAAAAVKKAEQDSGLHANQGADRRADRSAPGRCRQPGSSTGDAAGQYPMHRSDLCQVRRQRERSAAIHGDAAEQRTARPGSRIRPRCVWRWPTSKAFRMRGSSIIVS